jgi:voltage-gated potassium channel
MTHLAKLPPPRRRRLRARARYLFALTKRFRLTLMMAVVFFGAVPMVFKLLYRGENGARITFGLALHHTYFLMFGQPSLPYVGNVFLELLNFALPPFGIAVIADGVVRFAYLFFARRNHDKEWITVISETLRGHVIICGAGRVGYRVAAQLLELGNEVVVIEKRPDAPFVAVLQAHDVPVLIDDVKSPQALQRTNVKHAAAIVCATDDDLANLNTALDARRLNPSIRVVLRLFDDDLGARVRDAFQAEVLSSSALAAPALALSALDPRIAHSFHVGDRLMVVSEFQVTDKLATLTVSELQHRHRIVTLCVRFRSDPKLHPNPTHQFRLGENVTLQGMYPDYLELRAFTGERTPPVSAAGRTDLAPIATPAPADDDGDGDGDGD